MACSVQKVEAHVDYLTLTLPSGASDSARSTFEACCEVCLCSGGILESRRLARILGYLGLRSGSVFSGARADGSIMQASGALAADAFLLLWPSEARCTRIDIAVDVSYTECLPWVAEVTAHEAVEARNLEGFGKGKKVVLYSGFGAGDTCYLGSRQSTRMLRVYDKGAESGLPEYQNTWRWEIEAKGQAARGYFAGLKVSHDPAGDIAKTIEAFLVDRGVDCRPRVGSGDCVLCVERGTEASDLRRLDWLATGVAPTVSRLICVFGRKRVEFALGLGGCPGQSSEDSSV